MKTKLLVILLFSISLLFIACKEDTITEVVLPSNSITLSGDITDSFEAQAVAVLSPGSTSPLFSLVMAPQGSTEGSENTLLIMKEVEAFPTVGSYNVNFDQDDQNAFRASYTLNDSTLYFMYSGTIEITTSSSTKIEGNFNMTGPLFDLTPTEGNELTVKGKFSTVPTPL